jgi:outer membrane protein TolC
MKTVTNFLHPQLTEVINIGFAYAATGKIQTANNLASSYLYKNAISGEYPDYQIDYPNVRFTEGPISTQGINTTVVIEENQLRFSWTPDLCP